MKAGMADGRADRQRGLIRRETVQAHDIVDIDDVLGLGQPERHGGHEALPPGENTVFPCRDIGQQRNRFVNRRRRLVDEGGRFHRGPASEMLQPDLAVQHEGLTEICAISIRIDHRSITGPSIVKRLISILGKARICNAAGFKLGAAEYHGEFPMRTTNSGMPSTQRVEKNSTQALSQSW